MGVENSFDAYCLDSAVQVFGSHVQGKLDEVDEKTESAARLKRDGLLRRYIPELAKARKFADPGKR